MKEIERTPPLPGSKLRKRAVALIVLPLAFGLAGTVIGMNRSFNVISQGETVRAADLADGISIALISTMVALPFSLLGLLLLVISIYQSRRGIRTRSWLIRE